MQTTTGKVIDQKMSVPSIALQWQHRRATHGQYKVTSSNAPRGLKTWSSKSSFRRGGCRTSRRLFGDHGCNDINPRNGHRAVTAPQSKFNGQLLRGVSSLPRVGGEGERTGRVDRRRSTTMISVISAREWRLQVDAHSLKCRPRRAECNIFLIS